MEKNLPENWRIDIGHNGPLGGRENNGWLLLKKPTEQRVVPPILVDEKKWSFANWSEVPGLIDVAIAYAHTQVK